MKDYFVWLAKIVTIFVLILFVIPLLIGGIIGAGEIVKGKKPLGLQSERRIGVVELIDEIVDTTDVVDQLEEFANDDQIDGIVLRIDSPGGAVGPSEDVYSTVKRLRVKKPIIASLGGVAASGGYYAAAPCNKIITQASTLTGSIGVIMQIPNFEKVANTIGISMVTIKSGKMKDIGNSFRPMTDEERAYLEGTAGSVHENFIRAVAEGRSMDIAKVRTLADGRIYVGRDAVGLGLADTIGDVYTAGRAVYEELKRPLPEPGAPGSDFVLIYPEDTFKDFRKLLDRVESKLSFVLNAFQGTGARVLLLSAVR